MASFLPGGYKVPQSDREGDGASFKEDYLTFEKGVNLIRILSKEPVIGWQWWTRDDGKPKPHRVKEQEDVPKEVLLTDSSEDKAKHFWSMVVWNYQLGRVQVMTITQKGIMMGIQSLVSNEAWGDPRSYDITVTKTGEGMETKYQVIPSPKTKMEQKIIDAYKELEPDLDLLFSNGHPLRKNTKQEVEVEEVDIDDLDNLL